jgi:hypothetical protein
MRPIRFLGVEVGVGVFAVIWCIVWWRTPKGDFTFEPVDGFFDKLLPVYLEIAKFVMGLAAGGIVLVVGSSAVGQTKRLPQAYADPLFLLAMSIFYGVLFMVLLVLDYEAFKHKMYPYSRIRYIRNRVLGYSALACFCIGYVWLIWAAAIG